MAKLVKTPRKPKDGPTTYSNVFMIRYYCRLRKRTHTISSFCRDERNAKIKLRKFLVLQELGNLGWENPFKEQIREQFDAHQRLNIATCLTEFEADLRAGRLQSRGRAAVGKLYADTEMARLRKVITGLGIANADQLKVEAVNRWFDAAAANGTIKSSQTRRHYERTCRTWSRWLVSTGRLPVDPLARLQLTHVDHEADTVHHRTEFTKQEIAALVSAASVGKPKCGLSGPARSLLYRFASATGLRANECASVTKKDFTEGFQFVELAGENTKNGKKAQQPVPLTLREPLREFVAALAEDALLWPMADGASIDILKADADVAGVPVGRSNKDANGRVRDFHSFRHFFASELDRQGLSRSLRERLMRAGSGIVEKHYTHKNLADVAAAVEGLSV